MSGASPAAQEIYRQALRELQIYAGDPVATVDRALADSPGFVMGHALRAWLHLLGTEPAGVPVAREALAYRTRANGDGAGERPSDGDRASG